MSWVKELWWIALLGLVVQGFWAARLQHPSYFDAYYYTTNGQRLAAGLGFTEEIIWQYLDEPQGLPAPSHTYWMPLPSLVAAAGYALGGSFRAAQAPFWLMAGLLPLLGYAISWQLYKDRGLARAAALFTMAGGYYVAYWGQPTTFAPFAWAGGGCLLALALACDGGERNARKVWRWWLVAGVCAGLAHLTRADGLLIAGVAGLMWLSQAWEAWQTGRGVPWKAAAVLGTGYLVVMAPWFYHMWLVTGAPLSTVGTQTIFLTDYDDLFAYGRHFDWAQYVAWGWGNILRSKAAAVWLALQTYVAVIGLTVFSFFAVVAWMQGRREGRGRFLQAATWYAVILFVSMSLIFTFPGQRGSLLHSSTALWPWAMALTPAGIAAAVAWIAARRRRWRVKTATRFFMVALLVIAYLVTVVVAVDQPLRRDHVALIGALQEIVPPDAVVMASDPPGLHYHTGLRAVVTPNEPLPVLLEAAEQFGATYLLMDPGHPKPLSELYERDQLMSVTLVRELDEGIRLYRLPPAGDDG